MPRHHYGGPAPILLVIGRRARSGCRLGQVLANFRQQLARAVRFRHIFITASRLFLEHWHGKDGPIAAELDRGYR